MMGGGVAVAWYQAVWWSVLAAVVVAAGAAGLAMAWRRLSRRVQEARDRRRERYRAALDRVQTDGAVDAQVVSEWSRALGDGVFRDCLADAIDRADAEARSRLIAFCERSGYVVRLCRAAWSVWWWRRAVAARWLGRLGSREGISDLIRLSDDRSLHVRCVAISALGALRDPRIEPMLLKALDTTGGGRETSSHRRVPIEVVTAALIAQGASMILPLLSRLQEGPTAVREAVANVLSCVPEAHPRVRAALLGALRDADAEVRARAAQALGQIGYVGAVVPLADALSDTAWFVRLRAARALGLLGHAGAIRPLVAALTDESWQVRAAAGEALRRLGDPAVPALADCLLTSRDRYAKEQIVEELQRTTLIGEQVNLLDIQTGAGFAARRLLREVARHGATRILLDALRRHPKAAVRRRLVDVLGREPSPRVIAALHDVVTADQDAGVREAASRALTAGSRRPPGDVVERRAA
ncbi:MAG: HEAT repeat domain-containing protein [Nitrospirae bacterium]|nr:HEAT repeat domain-containing protein [Nitrospirota bacterium]